MKQEQRILLVDGNLLLFKSFYGGATKKQQFALSNSAGISTHAIHAFFNTLFAVFNEFEISHCFIAFDHGTKTNRHSLFPDYKAGRSKVDENLFVQMNEVRHLLDLMKFASISMPGFEGDDLIASMSRKLKQSTNSNILILSSDQDLLQLVDERVSIIYKPHNSKQYALKTHENFFELQGCLPQQIIEYKGLAGDSSDNLPGVIGIGAITAKKLLSDYSTLENIYENISNLSPKIQEKLQTSRSSAFLSRQLATLDSHVEINLNLSDLELHFNLTPGLEEKLDDLELMKLKSRFSRGY